MSQSYEGYIVISDITGYTAYLSGSELDHATDTLQDLLNTLLEHTQPPLAVSRLEGDAVFAYTPKGAVLQGQTLVEMVENIYVAFRRALELMELNTTCTCMACRNIPNLDLKFFVHYGTFALQQLSGSHKELVGSDVNLAHRLVKNTVTESTGITAYTMYTAAAVQAAGLGEIVTHLESHVERYEHFGDVQTYVQDMHGVWEARRDQQRILAERRRAWINEFELPLAPALAWDYVTKPESRALLTASDSQEISGQNRGRIAEGTEYVCAHGDNVMIHTILDWCPFESYTYRAPGPMGMTFLSMFQLEPSAGGTRITQINGLPIAPLPIQVLFYVTWLLLLRRPLQREWDQNLKKLLARIEADLAGGVAVRAQSPDAPREQVEEAIAASLASSQASSEPQP